MYGHSTTEKCNFYNVFGIFYICVCMCVPCVGVCMLVGVLSCACARVCACWKSDIHGLDPHSPFAQFIWNQNHECKGYKMISEILCKARLAN